jgi:DUF4097 and DUF4098 domain-containing protein YvlB
MFGILKYHRILATALILLSVLFAGCHQHDHWADGYHSEYSDYYFDSPEIFSVDAETTNGKIKVRTTSSDEGVVRVHKEIHADSDREAEEFAREVQIHFVRSDETIRIYITHPRPWDGVTVEVSYDVSCGRDADLNLRTLNGDIEINGTRSGVSATTTNGGIAGDLELIHGRGSFTTTNGSIDLRLYRCYVPVTARTVNGSVYTSLRDEFSGLLDAQTVNGRVRCSIPLTETDVQTERAVIGRIGEGADTPITLSCVNGNIKISEY